MLVSRLSWSKPAVYRLVRTLDDGRRIAPAGRQGLRARTVDDHARPGRAAGDAAARHRPPLPRGPRRPVGETVVLAVLDRNEIVYVDRIESDQILIPAHEARVAASRLLHVDRPGAPGRAPRRRGRAGASAAASSRSWPRTPSRASTSCSSAWPTTRRRGYAAQRRAARRRASRRRGARARPPGRRRGRDQHLRPLRPRLARTARALCHRGAAAGRRRGQRGARRQPSAALRRGQHVAARPHPARSAEVEGVDEHCDERPPPGPSAAWPNSQADRVSPPHTRPVSSRAVADSFGSAAWSRRELQTSNEYELDPDECRLNGPLIHTSRRGAGFASGRQDLNLRPPGPQPDRSGAVGCRSAL